MGDDMQGANGSEARKQARALLESYLFESGFYTPEMTPRGGWSPRSSTVEARSSRVSTLRRQVISIPASRSGCTTPAQLSTTGA